jgi:hypothetical protein
VRPCRVNEAGPHLRGGRWKRGRGAEVEWAAPPSAGRARVVAKRTAVSVSEIILILVCISMFKFRIACSM